MSSPAKNIYACTHSGAIHADEVTAAALLLFVYPEIVFIRSRNPHAWESADILFDVGGVYSPADLKFDHHQAQSPRRSDGIPYSSAGLVWDHFKDRLPAGHQAAIEEDLIKPIDRIDNGRYCPPEYPGCMLPNFINAMNITWLEKNASEQDRFNTAVALVHDLLAQCLYGVPVSDAMAKLEKELKPYFSKREEARERARPLVEQELEVIGDSPVLELPIGLSWSEIIDPAHYPMLRYVITPMKEGNWTIRSLPTRKLGIVSQSPFPSQWRGLASRQLQSVTGVPDAQFCHASGFCAIAGSREGAHRLAQLSLLLTKGVRYEPKRLVPEEALQTAGAAG